MDLEETVHPPVASQITADWPQSQEIMVHRWAEGSLSQGTSAPIRLKNGSSAGGVIPWPGRVPTPMR